MIYNKNIFVISLMVLFLCSCNHESNKISVKQKEDYKEKKIIDFVNSFISNNNNGYYISSTYKPGDKLYNPVLAIQRNRWDIAIPLLEKLVKENNPDAMYWLANISGGSIFSGKKMADLFERSAKLGNPYAALRLNKGAEDCDTYLSGYCSEEWGKKAKKILKDRATKGDAKAEYYLSLLNGNNYDDVLDLALKNAKQHYYHPISYFLKYDYNLKPELRKKLYSIMIDNYFIPVADVMYLNLSKDSFEYSFYENKLEKISYSYDSWLSIYAINSKFFHKDHKRDFIKKMITFDIMSDMQKKSKYLDRGFERVNVDVGYLVDYYNSILAKDNVSVISETDVKNMISKALKILNNKNDMVYIDEYFYKP